MEINSLNNNIIQEINTSVDSKNTNIIKQTEVEETSKLSNSYSISQDISPKRSNLHLSLNEYIKDVSKSQVDLSNLYKQNNILNDISSFINQIQSSNNKVQTSNDVHASVNELMEQYDSNVKSIKFSSTLNEEATSHTYFDGVFGSKPLKYESLENDVNNKIQEVQQNIKRITQKLENIKELAFDNIKDEVVKTEQERPFKNVDFGKHVSDFSSANINSVIGSVALSQANAIPANSVRLLS